MVSPSSGTLPIGTTCKVVVTVPDTHTEVVLQAIGEAGGGRFDDQYDFCAFILRGEGRFRPLAGSNPFIGTHGQIERVAEDRIEVTVLSADVEAVVRAIHTAHPYEVPVIDVYPLWMP